MAIVCPYCKNSEKVKPAKPGQYTRKCPQCQKPFKVIVPEDPSAAWVVRPLKVEVTSAPAGGPRPTHVADPKDVTGVMPPPKKSEAADVTGVLPPQKSEAADVTGVMPAPSTADAAAATGVFQAPTTGPAPGTATAKGASQRTTADKQKGDGDIDIPDKLGGYQVIKKIGAGGMGAVYLGRQIALDRYVALKVMSSDIAGDPTFLARFTREAYAAAQLVHHNVVQIYDIGNERDIHFFSMEFVPGQTLSDLVKKQGKVDVEVAIGYILQAARGLKFGHDLSIIHRDIKPDNLLINEQGIVKVADLGLVKFAGEAEPEDSATTEPAALPRSKPGTLPGTTGEITQVGSAMGTPTYMAPEQARDAAHVDSRTDIYSLGCTLYVLLTGKPPFEGKTVMEVLTKHAEQPVVPPDVVVKRVPKALSEIVIKMMAKKQEERYADMGEVIEALEGYLGVLSSGQFSPKEEHADALEDAVKRFNEGFTGKVRWALILGFVGLCAVLVLGSLIWGKALLALGFLSFAVLTPVFYFILNGLQQKTHLFLKCREYVFGSRWVDWLTWAAGAAFVLLLLLVFGLWWQWLAFCLAAALCALGLAFVIDRQIASERKAPIEDAEKLFRNMRLQGLAEETLRQFVCKYSGRRWEEFYEALFGYEAKLTAREWSRGELGKGREKFAAWREPMVTWIDSRQKARRAAKEKKHLQEVEEQFLRARGIDPAQARMRAEQMARTMVGQAAEFKSALAQGRVAGARSLFQSARRPEGAYNLQGERVSATERLTDLLDMIIGPKVRFLVGALLVTGCLLWVNQNQKIYQQKLKEIQETAAHLNVSDIQDTTAKLQEGLVKSTEGLEGLKSEPLSLPVVPGFITSWFDSFSPGIAGLILIFSAFFGGWKIGLISWPAALVALAGASFGLPSYLAWVVGLVLALVGFLFLREKRS
jgi:serine/threonine protein kinase